MNMSLNNNVKIIVSVEIQEYADFIGINLPEEEYMMELAK